MSNGRKKGEGNAKNGNRYLACVNVDRNFPRSVEVKFPTLCSR